MFLKNDLFTSSSLKKNKQPAQHQNLDDDKSPHMSHGNESMLPIQLTKTDVCQQFLCGHVRKGLNKCDK